ncbi:PAS domain-containing protein [Candidatus Lokiarchaeum ossiferum]
MFGNNEKVTDALWELSEGKSPIFTKGSVKQITGYSNEEIQKKTWFSLLHPDDVELVKLHFKQALELGQSFNLRYRLCHKSGNWLWLNDRTYDLKETNGTYVIEGIVSDITELIKHQINLEESEAKYRSLQNNIPDVLYKEDGRSQMSYISENIVNILGYTPSEITNEMWAKIVHPDDLPKLQKVSEQIFAEGMPFDLEYRIYHKDGTLKWIHERALAIAEHKKKISSYGIISDITKRKEMEKRLKISEDRWTFALECNQDGVWDWNLVTNSVFFSENWKKMLGYAPDEISHDLMEWDKLVHPEDKVQAYSDINEHIQGKTEWYVNEHRLLCKDGSYKWILDRGKVMEWDDHGTPTRFIGTHTDITERKIAEREKEKLINDLQTALSHVKQLGGLLPICAECKKVRDDAGYYHQIEDFLRSNSDIEFSHGLCPDCARRLYPDFIDEDKTA